VRADLASKYLRHSDLSAVRVAEILGYSDPTSLSRSFRRWHGRSIRQARKSG
jgi:AraC-like DNA-binding protein